MATLVRIPDVCERDIDLLLLEEFVASADFTSWFLTQIGGEEAALLSEAHRSVRTVNGESDVELTLQASTGTLKILIENKVDAAFQPNQPQRYADRANDYQTSGKCQKTITVVMAPEIYFGSGTSNLGFDKKVSYEAALRWFESAELLGARKEYKTALLRGAIERGAWDGSLYPILGWGILASLLAAS